jgi:hypothetical protein
LTGAFNGLLAFNNDGTLWVEHLMYTQLAFALDRVKALAPRHPEWKTRQPLKALEEAGEKGMVVEVLCILGFRTI